MKRSARREDSAESAPTRRGKETVEHVILLLHGIRDLGGWQERVGRQIEKSIRGTKCIAVRYGWFSPFAFLSPFSRVRSPVAKLKGTYERVRATYWGAHISIVAHSFGTHVVGECLRKHRTVRLHRLILCGGVLSRQFDWNRVTDQVGEALNNSSTEQPVLNECGNTDPWPVVAEMCVSRYGASGAYGFLDTETVATRYRSGGHGLFFAESHVETSWIPFLAHGAVTDSQAPVRTPTVMPRVHFSYAPARWFTYSVVAIAWMATLSIPTFLLAYAVYATIPPSVTHAVRERAGMDLLALIQSDGPHGTVSGYTPALPSSPLLEEPVAAINPVIREHQDVLVSPGPVSLNALIQKRWWHESVAITAYSLDVVRYEPMPVFVVSPEYGAGQVDSVTVRFALDRQDSPLPWRLTTTDAILETDSAAVISRDRPLAVTDDHPLQMRYVITAKSPGIYWVRPSLTAKNASGLESRLFLTRSEVALAFYDASNENAPTDTEDDASKTGARLLKEIDHEITLITSPKWIHLPAWEPGQQADREAYLQSRRRRLIGNGSD